MEHFAKKINDLNRENVYPFHMPGHKRRMELCDSYSIDITEIDGYDNLHSPEGMIKELEDRICHLYDCEHKFIEKSYVLVNGSTCGILAAISAVTNYGDKILMARNSHKSAYNAVCIRGLDADYIYPEYISLLGMNGVTALESLKNSLQQSDKDIFFRNSIDIVKDNSENCNQVPMVNDGCGGGGNKKRKDRKKYTEYRAVYITSPTYEGIVSDIVALSQLVHEYGIPLIVDEAHGAHFGLAEGFPDTAIRNGADIVIQSIHKTLMGMTQTAVLHVSSEAVAEGRVDIDKLEYYLRVYQSSSPSYVLMSSVDECVSVLENEKNRKELFNRYLKMLETIHSRAKKWKDIHIFLPESMENVDREKIFAYDCGKLVIYSDSGCMSGKELYDILRNKYNLQLEMSLGRYCLAMTSCMDSDEGFDRLATALEEIDNSICEKQSDHNQEEKCILQGNYTVQDKYIGSMSKNNDACMSDKLKKAAKNNVYSNVDIWVQGHRKVEKKYTIAQAFEMKKQLKKMMEGDIVGDYGYVYPPGIPFIVPGEVVTKDIICDIINAKASGYEVHGVEFDCDVPYMRCIEFTNVEC